MSKASLYKKLLEVKKKVPYLQKETKGFNFTYASPTLVLGTLNPLLNEAGIFLKSEIVAVKYERVEVIYKAGPKIETLYHLDMLFTWVDTEDGVEDACRWSASGMNGDEQGLGSALTYAERYFMLKFFNIPTDEDDPDALSVNKGKNKAKAPAKKAAPKKEESIDWLTEAQFDMAMVCTTPLMVENTIKKYTTDTHKMKKEYKEKLEALFMELQDKFHHEQNPDDNGTTNA